MDEIPPGGASDNDTTVIPKAIQQSAEFGSRTTIDIAAACVHAADLEPGVPSKKILKLVAVRLVVVPGHFHKGLEKASLSALPYSQGFRSIGSALHDDSGCDHSSVGARGDAE